MLRDGFNCMFVAARANPSACLWLFEALLHLTGSGNHLFEVDNEWSYQDCGFAHGLGFELGVPD